MATKKQTEPKNQKAEIHRMNVRTLKQTKEAAEKIELPPVPKESLSHHSRATGLTDLMIRLLTDHAPGIEMDLSDSEQYGLYVMLDVVRSDIDTIWLNSLTEDQRKWEMERREKQNA